MRHLACRTHPPVAQLDNAADSDSEERGFESLRAGQTAPLTRLKEERIENKYEIIKTGISALFVLFFIQYSFFFILLRCKNER